MTGIADAYQLALPGFEGPIEEAVELVQHGKLPLIELALSNITGQYLGEIQQAEELDLERTGDFIRNAARLLALKSNWVLAQPAGETEIQGETKPALGIAPIREAAAAIGSRLGESFPGVPRDLDCAPPDTARSAELLITAWGTMRTLRSPEVRVIVPTFMRLESAVSSLVRHLTGATRLSLRRLLRGRSREDAVMHFLAVLELDRRRQVSLEQAGLFEDIVVTSVARDEGESKAG